MENKKFKLMKKRVLKVYPKATTQMTNDGMYYVSTGTDECIMSEYMIPPQKDVYNAWSVLNDTIKINQNIQRTHPNRLDSASFEKRFHRVSRRNKRT